MKRFYIIKRAPENGSSCVTGNENKCYDKPKALKRAKQLASSERKCFVVFESVAAFEPVANVQEVEITDGLEE